VEVDRAFRIGTAKNVEEILTELILPTQALRPAHATESRWRDVGEFTLTSRKRLITNMEKKNKEEQKSDEGT